MPWTITDVDRHHKGLTDKQKKLWVTVANGALKRCQTTGGSNCEASAIRQANTVVNQNMSDEEVERTILEFLEEGVDKMPEKLYSLDSVEIFRTGKWKGKEYSDDDLEKTLANFEEFKSSWFRPAVKDGHHEEKGKPALGYIDKLKKSGGKILADIVDMPKAVYEAIKQHKYDRVSVELIPKMERNGKIYHNVLWALSLLGVEVPEVDGLKPLREVLESGIEIEAFDIELEMGTGEEEEKEENDSEKFALWTAKYINDLPDTAFAVISSGGDKDEEGKMTPRSLRHLPHHNIGVTSPGDNSSVDLPHLRNALARLPQTDLTSEEKDKARVHLEAHAKAKGIGGREKMKRTNSPADKKDKNLKDKEGDMSAEELKAEVEKLTSQVEDYKKKIEEFEAKKKEEEESGDPKIRTLVHNLSETQEKLSKKMEEYDVAQKKIHELEDQSRRERISQKVEKLRVPALRFFVEQFYDWATKKGDSLITFTQDGVKKEKLAEQIVDEFCGAINKATDNLLIQHSKVDTFKRDDTPGDDNPRVEVDNRIKAYMAEHPEVAYDVAMQKVFDTDPELKEAYARS